MSEIHVVPSESPNVINVVSGGNNNSVHVSNVADFYNLAKSWATSDELVENLDYSAKYYALQSADNAENAENSANRILSDAGFIAVSADLAGDNNIGTVADNIGYINIVSQNIEQINEIYTNIDNVNSVATNITNINAVNRDLNKINGVYENLQKIENVYSNSANINTVASKRTDRGN